MDRCKMTVKEEYLKQATSPVLALVKEIESFSGKEITLHQNSAPVSPTDPNPEAMSRCVSESRAEIYYRNTNVDMHGFVHELLHIRRWWLEGIPQILPAIGSDDSNVTVTSQIENSLEHLVIVPQEEDFGFEPYEYWNRTHRAIWEKFDAATLDDFVIRKHCFLGWLSIKKLVTDPEVRQLAEDKIAAVGLLKEANKFKAKIDRYANSKERQLSTVVRFLGIPRSEVVLVYFDIRNGRRTEVPVPRH